MRRFFAHPRAGLALVLLATAAAYAPSLGNGFAMDDRLVAVGVNSGGQPNARIQQLQPLAVYFATPYWADTNERDVLYRPLTILSYALRYRFAGDAAWLAHLANVVLHLISVALVYLLLRQLKVVPWACVLGAALFGMHAVHSEVVANVVGRAELLGFALGAGGLLLWLRGDGSSGARRAGLWLGSAVLLAGALFSKESTIAWVGFWWVYALALRWRSGEDAIRWREALALAARVATVAALPLLLFLFLRHRMIAQQGYVGIEVAALVNPLFHAPPLVRWLTATKVLAFGLLLVAAPFRLAADYSIAVFELVEHLWQPEFMLAAAALLGFGVSALWWRRKQPLYFLAAASFFGFTLITSNLLFPIGTIFGERLLYAPSLALPLLAVWLYERLESDAAHRALVLLGGAWLGASTLVVVQRNPVWHDDATLFLNEVRVQPLSVRMQVNAAGVRYDRGEVAAAVHHLEEAVRLDPEHALAWNNLAAIQLEQGQLEAAEAAVRRGLRAKHIVEDQDLFKLHCNLGFIFQREGRVAEGAHELGRCLRLEPGFLRAWRELCALETQGQIQPKELEALVEEGPERSPDPRWGLYRGMLAHRRGHYAEAVSMLEAALEKVPRYGPWVELRVEAQLALSDALLRTGDQDRGAASLRDIANDAFAPQKQRELASKVLEALR